MPVVAKILNFGDVSLDEACGSRFWVQAVRAARMTATTKSLPRCILLTKVNYDRPLFLSY